MNPPELNGSSLFLDFGGRKGRPTPLTISGGGSAWIGPLGITGPTEVCGWDGWDLWDLWKCGFFGAGDGRGGLLRQGCEGQGARPYRGLRMGSIKVAAAFVKSGLPSGNFAAEEDTTAQSQ